jgi:hypothetical protein
VAQSFQLLETLRPFMRAEPQSLKSKTLRYAPLEFGHFQGGCEIVNRRRLWFVSGYGLQPYLGKSALPDLCHSFRRIGGTLKAVPDTRPRLSPFQMSKLQTSVFTHGMTPSFSERRDG